MPADNNTDSWKCLQVCTWQSLLPHFSDNFIFPEKLIGYSNLSVKQKLPEIKQGIISVSDGINPMTDDISLKLNIIYAKDYSPLADIRVLIRNIKNIGINS